MIQTKKKIAIVSFPWVSNGPYNFLSDILKILVPITENIYVINSNTNRISYTHKKIELIDIKTKMHPIHNYNPRIFSIFFWILKCIFIQLVISFKLIKIRNNYDVIIFYLAYPYFIVPLITSKLIHKKSIEIITRSKPNSSLSKIIAIQDHILFKLLNGFSPESKAIINGLKLTKYKEKVLPEGSRFVNTEIFHKTNNINDRNSIGYIGRISTEKGIFEFLEAIPLINKGIDGNISFFIIGDGKDKLKVEKILSRSNLKKNVKFIDWISHKSVPDYLNKLKLLVLPTQHAEGLPTIILEAMACGTPVLTTKIGGAPDVIEEGVTGFLMKNNNYITIAQDVLTILNKYDLEKVSDNSIKFIENNFTYKIALKRWANILQNIDRLN